jgi:branched-subunit amino acid transport protein AzlD
MNDSLYILCAIAGMALVTFALRALPFVAAQWLKRHALVAQLGDFLPLAIMTLLLVHAMSGSAREHTHGPWFELVAIAVVVLLQWRCRNALLSIICGTTLYVALRNGLFF